MKRRTKKAQDRARRRAQREAGMRRPGGESMYARKARYCRDNGVWGFDVMQPKPWRAQ